MTWQYDSAAFCEAEREAEQATFVRTSTGVLHHHQVEVFRQKFRCCRYSPLSRAIPYSKDNSHLYVQVNAPSVDHFSSNLHKTRAEPLRCWNPATVGHHICLEVSLWRIMASLARMVSLFRWLGVIPHDLPPKARPKFVARNFTCQVGETVQDAVGEWVNGGHGKSMTFQMHFTSPSSCWRIPDILGVSLQLSAGWDEVIFFFVDLDHPMPHDGRLSNLQFPFVTESQVSVGQGVWAQKNGGW